MEQLANPKTTLGWRPVRCWTGLWVRAPAPRKGLTFRKGKREANVHEVKGWHQVLRRVSDGDDWPAVGYTRPRSTRGQAGNAGGG